MNLFFPLLDILYRENSIYAPIPYRFPKALIWLSSSEDVLRAGFADPTPVVVLSEFSSKPEMELLNSSWNHIYPATLTS